jgi:hypothetical protein
VLAKNEKHGLVKEMDHTSKLPQPLNNSRSSEGTPVVPRLSWRVAGRLESTTNVVYGGKKTRAEHQKAREQVVVKVVVYDRKVVAVR